MRFTKMHGIGNDYIFIDCFEQPKVMQRDSADLARRMSDRHYGVGSDGLILICPPESAQHADVRMRMFNADGSESEMCGNGLRCLVKYVLEKGISERDPLRVQTGAGALNTRSERDSEGRVVSVTVEMGAPVLEPEQIPVDVADLEQVGPCEFSIESPAGRISAVFVSMGNPHLVSFLTRLEDLEELDVATVGAALEHHPAFPKRMNVHFAFVHGESEASMRTWERGSGITLACGTGACAVLVAGVKLGKIARQAKLRLPGGDLNIAWPDDEAQVLMTGPAKRICDGVWQG